MKETYINMNRFLAIACSLTLLFMLHACDKPAPTAVYAVGVDGSTSLYIEDWNVLGPLTPERDSLMSRALISNPQGVGLTAESDARRGMWHDGPYHPQYGQLDLREVFGIGAKDTTKVLDSLVTYLSCTIRAERDMDMFLHVNTQMACRQYVNGDSLVRMDFKEPDLYPVHLRAGDNTLVVRTQGAGEGYWYEATLCDSASAAALYAELHTGNIVRPVIVGDSIVLTEAHWGITDVPVRLLFHDVNGNRVAETLLRKGVMNYRVDGLQDSRAYICDMVLAGDTVRQPVMTYALEEVEERFRAMRDSLPEGHPRADEIDQMIYRVWKLNSITGKMREDPWFPFKFPWVAYQLEHVFAHLDGTYGNDDDEYNFKFITYRSRLDGCLQRYVLVTPNHVDRDRRYPLVVVVRPDNANRYHLFFCPQIAHQWVVNHLQAVAEKYGIFIMMPEARMLLNEDLMPFADAEMRLAMADVQEHYNIDPDRIFLHANCSGGYRALRLATYNPDLFAGVALYAPVYRRNDVENVYMACSPETMLKNLRNVPLLIYGDPVDTHSPFSGYADLVRDCREYGVPYQLTMRRNTGAVYNGYHRLVVGHDACKFFMDKRKQRGVTGRYSFPPRDTTVADFYSKPFMYVYNAADTSAVYRKLVRDIREEYEGYLYSRLPLDRDTTCRMPLIPDTRVTRRMLTESNVLLVGEDFRCRTVKDFAGEVVSRKPKVGVGDVILTAMDNPYNKDGMALLYTSGSGSHFRHSVTYPWKHGFRRTVTGKAEK